MCVSAGEEGKKRRECGTGAVRVWNRWFGGAGCCVGVVVRCLRPQTVGLTFCFSLAPSSSACLSSVRGSTEGVPSCGMCSKRYGCGYPTPSVIATDCSSVTWSRKCPYWRGLRNNGRWAMTWKRRSSRRWKPISRLVLAGLPRILGPFGPSSTGLLPARSRSHQDESVSHGRPG